MQKHLQIKALFFLGIFSMLLVHQVVPHWHHQHDGTQTEKILAQGSNDHTHEHQHDSPKDENSKKSLLDLFLNVHTHSTVSNELLITRENSAHQTQVKKNIPFLASEIFSLEHIEFGNIDKPLVYHPPNNYFNPYLSIPNLRGPPTLG